MSVTRIIVTGGMGDVLITTPSLKAIKEKFPNGKLIVYCLKKQYFEVYRNNPYIDRLKRARFISAPFDFILYYLKPSRFLFVDYWSMYPSLHYKRNAVHVIAEMLGVELKDEKIQLWITEEEDEKAQIFLSRYSNPIVIHITSLTSKNQEWPLEYWERLVEKMPDQTFIQIGHQNELKVKGTVDATGTTFRDALALIKHSKCFAGIPSSFSQATNAFDIPGVVLFGGANPVIWGHKNNINIYKAYSCSPCIDILVGSKCPYNSPCVTTISVDEVKEAISLQLNKGKKLVAHDLYLDK